ncbi:MAG: hypothetical protein J1F43_01415 [Muribaculaceae bacterium]|nr:hypothetical protein [Muribaculaceae bacterium]
MSQHKFSLSYLNEDDRAYGLAGMMVALANIDAIDRVATVTIDTDGPMVEFSHAYYFSGSPSISPKSTWDNLVANFHLTTSMVVGNILARSIVRLKEDAPAEVMKEIYDIVEEEGKETCELESDEVETLYNHALSRALRVFRNPRVHPAIDEFARIISLKRSLSGREVIDELHLLQLI